MTELRQEQFDLFIQEHEVVLVDFFATWCGPCRAMAPSIEALAKEMADRAGVAKIDIDGAPDLASRFGIRAVPTFVFFKNGEVVETISGARTKEELKKKLEELL